jgi:hypothetical protein
MDITPQRGAIAIDLDRPRLLFFDMTATWLVIQKYGHSFLPELYTVTNEGRHESGPPEITLRSMDALAFFLWAGLQADAKAHGEEFTLEQAVDQVRPLTYTRIFMAVLRAITWVTSTPAVPGKGKAAQARPARPATKTQASPGPTRVSTSMKRNGSRSRS